MPVDTTHNALQMMTAMRPTYIAEKHVNNEMTEEDDGIGTTENDNVTIATPETVIEQSDVEEFRRNVSTNVNNTSLETDLNKRNYAQIYPTLEAYTKMPNEQKNSKQYQQLPSSLSQAKDLHRYDSSTEAPVLSETVTQQSSVEDESKFKSNEDKVEEHHHHFVDHDADVSARHLNIEGTLKPTLATR